jgi:hypothetical protein
MQIPSARLAGPIGAAHGANVAGLRTVDSVHLEKGIDYATWRPITSTDPPTPDDPPTADEWDTGQREALNHIVHALDILRVGGSLVDFTARAAHASVTLRSQLMEVLAVNGPSHEQCLAHVDQRFVPPPREQLLLITRDPQCTKLLPRQRSFVRADPPARIGTETKITDVNSARIHVAFGELIESYTNASDSAGLEASLYARLAS